MLECALEFKRYTPGSSVLTVALRVAKYLEFSGNLCPEKIVEEGGGGGAGTSHNFWCECVAWFSKLKFTLVPCHFHNFPVFFFRLGF